MKKVVTFFGPALIITLLFEIVVDSSLVILILFRPFLFINYLITMFNGVFISQLVEVSFLLAFVVGIFHALKGIYMILLLQKDRARERGKQEIFRGISGLFLALLLYYLVSYIASFYGI